VATTALGVLCNTRETRAVRKRIIAPMLKRERSTRSLSSSRFDAPGSRTVRTADFFTVYSRFPCGHVSYAFLEHWIV
jgi:hypothetical protein